MASKSHTTTDHDEIRRWVEEHVGWTETESSRSYSPRTGRTRSVTNCTASMTRTVGPSSSLASIFKKPSVHEVASTTTGKPPPSVHSQIASMTLLAM